ncbi:MAG: polysaccharide deacetylase family protein, partial [Anaerolineae bacterium]|nr:polysaccharide deacetylase family protein [Anaerolineae bacterium]
STKPPPSTPTQTPPCNNCVAYLTFDDGPDPSSLTLSIATELARNQIRATFFFSGTDFNSSWTRVELTCDEYSNTINEYDLVEGGVEQNTSQAAAIEGMGHASGIHGWLHQPWPDGMDADIQIGHEISELNKVGSHPENFQLLRAPYGGFPKVCEGSNCRDLPIGGYENWYYYNWTIDSCDAAFSEKECIRPVNSAADIVANVAYGLGFDPEKPFRGQSGVHPERNPIILLHSIKNSTANSILQNLGNEKLNLITALREMGYTTFMSLPRPGDNRGIPVIGGNR